ncbi:unnamed protein product [Calicophoron daubneyi]|uniref:L-type lectin-like domain-containing protein n=1 Tax=Calicophoron daubneyi TaxID=300641 RepID=A0AAV2TMU3_CALDB
MYSTEHKIRTRLYLTLLVWISVQPAGASDSSENKRIHPEHSLLYPMPSEPNLWNLGGTARFLHRYLNLVPKESLVAGVAWNGVPVDYCNWELNIWFSINSHTYHAADGWALFYTVEPITNVELDYRKTTMGGPNDYNGIALIYDSFDNSYLPDGYFPRIYPVLLDGSYKQVHSDNGVWQRRHSCFYPCGNTNCKVLFRYKNRQLYMKAMNWRGEWRCDWTEENVVLPAGGYFSFTAFNDKYYFIYHETVDIREFKVEEILDGNECFERDGQKPKW